MKLNVYSIFDSAAKAYTSPFFMHNDGLAIRAFQDNVNAEQENNISKHPDQFTLFKLGEYDDKTGKVTPLETPLSMAIGVSVITDTTPQYSNVDLEKVIEAIKELKI